MWFNFKKIMLELCSFTVPKTIKKLLGTEKKNKWLLSFFQVDPDSIFDFKILVEFRLGIRLFKAQ